MREPSQAPQRGTAPGTRPGDPVAARRESWFELGSWAFYDWANSAFAAVISTFIFAAYFTRQVAENETVGTALWGNVIGISGVIVAVCGPVIGAIADQGGRRKPWLAVFTAVCVGATALLWFVRPAPDYVPMAVLLVAVATIGAECASIFYNAMLPGLAQPGRLGRWSGWGWSLGYLGGLLCLAIALFAFVRGEGAWIGLDREQAEHVRATFVLTALWYLVFSLPLFLFTPDRGGERKPLGVAAREGVRQLRQSIREARRYRVIWHFLIARMIYIDGLATVFAFGGVYAAGAFDMDEQQVLLFAIALNVTAGIGAAAFAWIDDRMGSKRTIVLSLAGLVVTSVSILLARSQTAFWVFGLLLGVFVGPVQAASRSFLARAAPPALRTQMFGLFALSGKATAFVGPLLVGWLTYWSGSQRIGMSSVVAFFLCGLWLMWRVPEAPVRS